MTPAQTVVAVLSRIEAKLAKLTDTDEGTVCAFEVAALQRQLQAQIEMAERGLLEEEIEE